MDKLMLTLKELLLFNNISVTKVDRNSLYFNKYVYSVYFYMQEVHAVKLYDHTMIDEWFEMRQNARRINYGGSWSSNYRHAITDTVISDAKNAHDALKKLSNYKLTTSWYNGYLYTNNIDEANEFLSNPGINVYKITQVNQSIPKDSMIIKSANHEQRTYFKGQRINTDLKTTLVNFLYSRKDIRLSPSFSEWSERKRLGYIQDNFFIDHNDDGFLMLLALVAPQLKVKKTLRLLTE